jgi:hypothetical protein
MAQWESIRERLHRIRMRTRAAGSTAARPRTAAPARGRWELLIAVAIGVVTVTGAVITYLSIQEELDAADNDQRAVIETVIVEGKQTGAQIQTYADGGLAARYRRMLADSDAISRTDPEQARLLRALAVAFGTRSVIYQYLLSATDPTAQFDYETRLQAALHSTDLMSVPDDQPDRAVIRADAGHRDAQLLKACVVGLLVIVVLLTLARLTRTSSQKVVLLVLSAAGYVTTVVVAITQLL